MKEVILLSFLIVLVQLFDSYLRWLAFYKELSHEKASVIWKKLSAWSATAFLIYFWIFSQNGIGALNYKLILMLGEIPILAIFLYYVGGNFFRHIFVFNLVSLWIFILHSISASVVVLFFCKEIPTRKLF